MGTHLKLYRLVCILVMTGFFSCNPAMDILPVTESLDFSIIDGDTIRTEVKGEFNEVIDSKRNSFVVIYNSDSIITYKEPVLNKIPSKRPDIANLKNRKLVAGPVKMISLGQSLSAGVRDGGYFNEGILTSFPNLLARQMAIENFSLPLFSPQEYNGIGRGIITGENPSGGPLPKFVKSKNNLAAKSYDEISGRYPDMKKLDREIDHLAIAGDMSRVGWETSPSFDPGNNLFSRFFPDESGSNKEGIIGLVKAKKFDFFILEVGNQEIIQLILGFGNPMTSLTNVSLSDDLRLIDKQYSVPEIKLVRDALYPSGANGVLLNLPNWLEVPYFVEPALIEKVLLKGGISKQETGFLLEEYLFKSSSGVDSLLSPQVAFPLKPSFDKNQTHQLGNNDVLTTSYSVPWISETIKKYNDLIRAMSNKFGYPVVDMNGLYSRVINGGFVDESGLGITSDNFFSEDKFYPSPLGNAVIANEIIKTINKFYGTNISLINTRAFQ